MTILHLGCGIGFRITESAVRGFRRLVAADLTPQALDITRRRLALHGVDAELREDNAQALSLADASFDHVNCQGVIHHTPEPEKAVAEIARVLKPGGTASISVYYRNPILRLWPFLRWAGYPLARLGVEETFVHFFPARALPVRLPRWLHRWLDGHLGFMIYASVREPCAV